MLVRDLVMFNKESYYNGAVQTEWFYDEQKVSGIACSYVFHGPKYYGVTNKDVTTGGHTLIDTASFVGIISNKLEKQSDNNFILAIAGYGTGKSHLAVTLGALFGGPTQLQDSIISNIGEADGQIAAKLQKQKQKNLVIALNGMRNFNLDAEILRCARATLSRDGISDEPIRSLTKTYDNAKYFINENFDRCNENFEKAAENLGVSLSGNELKDYLKNRIETDATALEIVNSVYKIVNGDTLHWNQGISAGEIIACLCDQLCGEGKPYNKILLLFDEFGRYIEYVAANPTIAGDAALQQIFEAIQNVHGKAVFVGFIQYELEAYLSHIDKTSNVLRYVGRFKASEKYYLSSNFETILANLLRKIDNDSFARTVQHSLDRYKNYHEKIYNALKRWCGNGFTKNVWLSERMYRNVILEGCFPMHPMTVWILSGSSRWMQQRSTIAFCADMIDAVADKQIENDWLPYVYPVDIIDSGIFSEMLNAEEKGLVQSQNCMLYREILSKIGAKLSANELQVLKAILIIKVANFTPFDKEDAVSAMRYCSNLKDDEIRDAIKHLEDQHGVIAYDESAKSFDLIAEANGFNEFKRVYSKYRTGKYLNIEDIDEETQRTLGLLDPIDTSFAQDNHISSSEWKFEKRLLDSTSINEQYLSKSISMLSAVNNGESYRGLFLFAYCHGESQEEVERIREACENVIIENSPLIIAFLDDSEGDIIKALTIKNNLNRFSLADRERFLKHISDQKRIQDKTISSKFNAMVMERRIITEKGLMTYNGRMTALCTERFNKIFTSPVPFVFDGFDNVKPVQAKKTFATICIKLFDQSLMNIHSYQALSMADKNRVRTCISTGNANSWQIFNNECCLVLPQNELIRRIYDEVDSNIRESEPLAIGKLFGRYLRAPFGMNIYSLSLFIVYFIQKQGKKVICRLGSDRLTSQNFSNVIMKDGKLKYSDLQRVTIIKNANSDENHIADICNEILENTDVNRCEVLRARLNDAVALEGENDNTRVLIGQARVRLDDGSRLLGNLKKIKGSVERYFDEANKKMVIPQFINIFDYLKSYFGVIEEGLPYVYGNDFLSYMLEANKIVNDYLGVAFSKALMELACPDITQLGIFQTTYERVISILKDQGYESQAKETAERVEIICKETKARNQYNQALGEVEKDIALLGDPKKASYAECSQRIEKFKGWLGFFEKADMPDSIKLPITNSINQKIKQLKEYQTALLERVECLDKRIAESEDYTDFQRVYGEIQGLLAYQFDPTTTGHLENIHKSLEDLENKLNKIPLNVDEIDQLIQRQVCENVYDQVYKKILLENKKKAEEKEEEWIENTVECAECDEITDAQQCVFWLEKLRNAPSFISKKGLNRTQNAITHIEKQLHKCRVQGVLSLYYALTEDEKKEFLKIIEK